MAEEALHFLVLGTDAEGSAPLRQELRPRHRAWLREHPGHEVTVLHGGPTMDPAGRMNGTLLILAARSEEAVRDFVAGDPYVRAALFRELEIRRWGWTLGR